MLRVIATAVVVSVASAVSSPLSAQQNVTEPSPALQASVPATSPVIAAPVPPAAPAQVAPAVPAPTAPADARPATTNEAASAVPAGKMDAGRAGIARINAPAPAEPTKAAAAASMGKGENVALMVVGGAALISGLIIGGDAGTLVAIGGAAVGLWGLYNYIK